MRVTEASPDPPQGPARDRAAALAEARIVEVDKAVTLALSAYLDRIHGVTRSRMRGPTARKDTRWWRDERPRAGPAAEVKAVDTAYVVPAKLVGEIDAALRPVMARVAAEVAAETADRLGLDLTGSDDPFAADATEIARAVDEAMAILAGVAARHAEIIRGKLKAADAEAATLTEVLEHIDDAYAQGRSRLLVAGRTVGAALRNDVAVSAARALGVTHSQWLSKRDAAVRHSHRQADGQVRLLDDRFAVGGFELRFPGDPTDLPKSWPVIAQCRCGLLFGRPDPRRIEAAQLISAALRRPSKHDAARALLDAARDAEQVPVPDGVGLPGPAHRVTVPEPVVGYRRLADMPTVSVGQWLMLAAPVVLGLAAAKGAAQLTVAIPAGVALTVVAGAVVLDQTAFEVIGTSPEVTAARVAT